MALIDTYRNNISRKRSELAKLSQDRAKESPKIANQQQKIVSAKRAISSTKSESTIKSRLNDIKRAEEEIAKINKKIADFDTKIAKKDKEIADEERKYRQEEQKELKKKTDAAKKQEAESKKVLKSIDNTLRTHEQTQRNIFTTLSELQKIPEKIIVLFLASNPDGTGKLRLDEEARDILEKIRLSEYRNSVEFITRWAVRTSDILQAINETNPTVIHFSGHGTDTDELVLQNTDGSPKFVSKEAIVQVISTVSDNVRLVFFNTCFSFGQAEAVIKHVDAAIGMVTSVGDEAAKIFASYFYSSIGFGKSLDISFRQAQAAMMLEGITGEDTPQLYIKDGLTAEDIILVRPPSI